MKAEDKSVCQVCGTPFPADSDFCPVCVLRGAVGDGQATSELAADPTPLSSELRFEHYTVLQNTDGKPFELGRGAMGVTYKAFDVHLQCPVALKIINAQLFGNDSARLRFVREARAAASVRHPNVASVFHLGESGRKYYYAMEFVDGESLQAFVRRSGCLETDLALEIVGQVAAGLAAIQSQRLVHRDIKSSNVMVSLQDGKLKDVKIIDLGLAKGVAEENALSTVGAFFGTPAYASPEQFAGIAIDIRSDLYSLGITLWEMLSGKLPFRGSAAELMYQHQHAELPTQKLKSALAPVIPLLQVLLAKDPHQRFQSPAQLRNALTKARGAIDSGLRLTADELRLAGDQTTENLSKGKPRKQNFRWILGAGLCFAALLLAWFMFFDHARSLFNQRATEAIPSAKSIAVLPFENISANKDDAYFADGVQDEILNNLAKIAQLKVISRTSVMQYRGNAKRDLRQIAAALGVANVLEGTVRRDGKHVRVSTDLVEARNDNTIWADSYDRDSTDIFAIQSEIAQEVASKLSAKLSPKELKWIEERPTTSLEAYDLYLRAKQLVNSVVLLGAKKETLLKAISLLEQATQKDSEFALAYCLMAKANDILYFQQLDRTPGRRALADATVNDALRLRPDLPEVHLAVAIHAYTCYRDYERARNQIAIAAQALPNNPVLLELIALIDQAHGKWEEATAGLEKATALDPQNPDLLDDLARNFWWRRLYKDNDRVLNRLIELQPGQPWLLLRKEQSVFAEKADLSRVRNAYEAVPSSIKDDTEVTSFRFYLALCARDFASAVEIVDKSPNEELSFVGAIVPRRIVLLWIEFLRGNHPTVEDFGAAREELYRKVEGDPSNPFLMTALALADVALGRKAQGAQEGQRAMEMRPISEDAVEGSIVATTVALAYTWANRPDTALELLAALVQMPSYRLTYGDLKTYPGWDPLRKDPRFDKLLANVQPRE